MDSIKLDTGGLERALARAPEALATNLKKELGKSGRAFDLHFKLRRLRAGGVGVRSRTGFLRNSFTVAVLGESLDDLQLVYATQAPYAPIHEYGGVITPKRGKWLTIPTDANKTPAGVMKESARSMFDRGVAFGVWRKNAALSMGIYVTDTKFGKLVKMFHIKKQVTIEPRLGLREEWEEFRPELLKRLNRAINTTLVKGKR